MSQRQQVDRVKAKVYYQPGNQVRRLMVGPSGYNDLIEHLTQLYLSYGNNSSLDEKFELQLLYLDHEGDWISVNSEQEWTDAVNYFVSEQQGRDNIWRLRVLVVKKQQQQQQDQKQVHRHIVCDGCDTRGIEGTRYKCETCPDYDLCESCYAKRSSDPINHHHHQFTAIEKPSHPFRGHCPWRFNNNNAKQWNGCHNWKNKCGKWKEVAEQFKKCTSADSTSSSPLGDVIQELAKAFTNVPTDNNNTASQPEQSTSTQGSTTQPFENMISNFLGQFAPQQQPPQQQNTTQQQETAPKAEEQAQQQQQQYESELTALQNMGFYDSERCVQLLNRYKGNVSRVVAELLS